MSGQLYLSVPQLPDMRARMLWDALAIRLDIEWIIKRHTAPNIRIEDGHRSLTIPLTSGRPTALQVLHDDGKKFALLADEPLLLSPEGTAFRLNSDIITPVQRMTSLILEDQPLPRAADGTLAGVSYGAHQIDASMLGFDHIGELAALLSHILKRPLPKAWQALAPNAPYAVIMTFDCDGFFPGQPDALRRFLDNHEVTRPTVFVMAPDEADLSLYDARYDPADPALRSLYDTSEIGLHSSYSAYHDGTRLVTQKRRLEDAIERGVRGHRSHYLRFGFPYTWGHLAQAGFQYDMTMGFYDLPGYRQGGSHPIPLADPSGRGRMLWSWGVGVMDQHLFMQASPLTWREGAGTADLAELLARTRATGGTLVLDWHVHTINSDQFPHHFDALGWLLTEARRDGAWIGGAGLLLDQYRARPSTRSLLTQLEMRTTTVAPAGQENRPLHTDHYVEGANDATLTSVEYMDTGAHSFLAALPADANRIVDIGCGSGWISHRVPPLRQVLGVDIDEGITTRISRRAAVGALPNLPLEDEQADLILNTDVIEHLSPELVRSAGVEFDRISTRYAYLQTPREERLEDSERHCSACDARWHVNHHLASHDAASLTRVMPPSWYPHTVIHTGESRVVDSSLRNAAGEILGDHPMQGQRFTCDACGHVNEPMVSMPDSRMKDANTKLSLPLPNHSEVAVLLARRGDVARFWQDAQPMLVSKGNSRAFLPAPYGASTHSLDFSKPIEEVVSISPTYHVPCVVVQNALVQRHSDGADVVLSGLAEFASVFMMFPDQHAAGERMILEGKLLNARSAPLTLQTYNWMNESCDVEHYNVKGAFRLELTLRNPAYLLTLHVKKGIQVRLYRASVTGSARRLYVYDAGRKFGYGHVEMHHRGTQWRWALPPSGRIWTDRPFTAQVRRNLATSTTLPSAPVTEAMLAFGREIQRQPEQVLPPPTTQSIMPVTEALLPFSREIQFEQDREAELQRALKRKRGLLVDKLRRIPRIDRHVGRTFRYILPSSYYYRLREGYIRLLCRLLHRER